MRSFIFKKASAAVMAAAMVFNGAVAGVSNIVVAADENKYEFEDAEFTGDVTIEEDAKASGGSMLKMTDSGTITLKVKVDKAGSYKLTFYALGIGGDKQQNLTVNGDSQGAVGIPKSNSYEEISIPAIMLKEGENTITIEKSWGWSQFDYMTVTSMADAKITATQTTPSDQLATVETQSLMAYLAEVYGKNIISGQQEIYSGGPHGLETEFEYLNDLTGHYPAIRGFDYGNFCCPAFGSDDGSTKRVIDWVKNKNGIATASFHLNVPKDFENFKLGSRIDWSNTTYTAKDTDFSPSKAATEGTKENEYYMTALKTLAAEFNKLEAEGIPVIWRPLHEAEGGGGETGSWFWWGREGSAAYKQLWVYTYKVLTEDLNCHNLIWEWNSYNFATSENWYPGDDYVDIIGYDKYSCTDWSTGSAKLYHNDSPFTSTFYGIMDKYKGAKMVSMAENDSFSNPEKMQAEGAGWLYFCTWYDGGSMDTNFLSEPTFNTKEDTIAMYQSDYCITLDELPANLYSRDDVTPPDPSKTTPKTTTATTTTAPRVTTTSESDPNKSFGKVTTDAVGNISVKLPEASEDIYLRVDLPENCTYANGGLGVSIPLDGEYYWANVKWEATKSGDVKINLIDNLLNVTLGTDEVKDEAIIEKAKEILAKQTEFQGQVWYAANGADALDSTDGVYISAVYVAKGESSDTTKATETTTTTSTTSAEADKDVVYGDANCDSEVSIADAVLIMQSIANPTKFGEKGTDKNHITTQGTKNADCCDPGDGVTNKDALAIQKKMLNLVELPEKTAK